MAIADDFSVAANGDIRHTSGTTNYTVLEFYRYLMNLSDDTTSSGDDILDITKLVSQVPASRSFDTIIVLNGNYNIDDDASEYLYAGSISQNGANDVYYGLKIIGTVNDTTNTALQVIQDGARLTNNFWGDQSGGGYNGDATAGVLARFLVKGRSGGSDIDGKRVRVQARTWGDSYDYFNTTLADGESVAAISTVADGQNDTSQGTVTAYSHVTNTEGFQLIDINNGNGDQEYYSKWTYGADTSGDGLKGLYEFVKDLCGRGTAKTIHGINGELFLGITHSWAYDNEASGPFSEDEELSWGTGTTAGTGLLLALDDDGATGNMYIQLLTGVAPVNNAEVTGGTSSATCDVNGTPSQQTVPKSSIIGNYTGSIVGAFGIGIDAGDLSSTDAIVDLSGTTQTPPNNITVTVAALTSGESEVLLGRDREDHYTLDYDNEASGPFTLGEALTWSGATGTLIRLTDGGTTGSMEIRVLTGSAPADNDTITGGTSSATCDTDGTPAAKASLQTDTYALAAGNSSGNGTLVVKTAIASTVPAAGEVRVWNESTTSFDRYTYTSWATSTFTLSGTLSRTYLEDADCFDTFIDGQAAAASMSNTLVYGGSPIAVVGVVADGGSSPTVPFPLTGSISASGYSVSAVSQSDV